MYHYLKHLIQLWLGDWVKQMEKMNESFGINNRLTASRGNSQLVSPFIRQYFWKFIGCILQEVTYGNKGHNIWSEIPKTFGKKPTTNLQIDVSGNTDLNKVCCDIYHHVY